MVLSRIAESGVGLLRVLKAGVGIFYPTPTPDVQFLYILVMLTTQLTRPRVAMECSAVIFLREPWRLPRHSVQLIKSLHLKFKQIVFCVVLCLGSRLSCFPFFNPVTGSKCQVHNQLLP